MVSLMGDELVNWIIAVVLVLFAAILLIYLNDGARSFFDNLFTSFGK